MEGEAARVWRPAVKHVKKLFKKGLVLTQDQRIQTEKLTADEL